MIRLALPNSPYIVPETGLPVEGRMKVFLHDSDEYAHLYTLEGGEYVQAENPQLLHAGLTDSTIFTALGVFDVVIEKYIGAEGMLSVESPDTDFEPVGDYEVGMDFDIASYSRYTVNTVEELREVNPELGMVTVKWYAEEGDCPPRTYVWDGESENQEDGGYVIGSDVSDTGKWILMWDDEVLPCGVYGVKPGTEANVSLLLSYPAVVGSFQMATAPRVRFTRGEYTSNNNWTTAKELVFDPGAKFTSAMFTCPKVQVIGKNDSYVADFVFTAADAVAHSSWFRRAMRFWDCKAKELVVDDMDTQFTSKQITTAILITGATVKGTHHIALTYGAGTFLRFDNCVMLAKGIFTGSDYLSFKNCVFDDKIFTDITIDFGLIAQGHCVDARTSDGVVFDIDHFINADSYVNAMIANGETDLDLRGRLVSYVEEGHFTSIRNGFVDTLNVNSDTQVLNLSFTYLNATGGALMLDRCTGVVNKCSVTALNVKCSKLSFSNTALLDQDATTVYIADSVIYGLRSNNEEPNYETASAVTIKNSALDGCRIWGNSVQITNCTLNDVSVEHYPIYSNSKYFLNIDFDNNILTGDSRLDIVPCPRFFAGYGWGDDTYEVEILKLHIVGNQFNGSDVYGVRVPFYGGNAYHRFIKGSATVTGDSYMRSATFAEPWTYRGNTGTCPLECIPFIPNNSSSSSIPIDGDTYKIATGVLTPRVFCIPASADDGGNGGEGPLYRVGNKGKKCAPSNNVTLTGTNGVFQDTSFDNVCLFPSIALDDYLDDNNFDNNDLFKVHFCCKSGLESAPFKSFPG